MSPNLLLCQVPLHVTPVASQNYCKKPPCLTSASQNPTAEPSVDPDFRIINMMSSDPASTMVPIPPPPPAEYRHANVRADGRTRTKKTIVSWRISFFIFCLLCLMLPTKPKNPSRKPKTPYRSARAHLVFEALWAFRLGPYPPAPAMQNKSCAFFQRKV